MHSSFLEKFKIFSIGKGRKGLEQAKSLLL